MSNVHGLHSNKKKGDDEDDDDNKETRFVGGLDGRGGGSGLAVEPNYEAEGGGGAAGTRDGIFNLAEQDTTGGGNGGDDSGSNSQRRRTTITMYRDGFVVDDGPFRRLDDPANADFLRSLAQGRTPKELFEGEKNPGNVTVGLVDKRSEDYVETFRSFTGTGTSLGGGTAASAGSSGDSSGIIDPSTITEGTQPSTEDGDDDMTSIQVRLMNGKRCVIKISVKATIQQLALKIVQEASTTDKFSLSSGYPPKQLTDLTQTVEDAGLKGSQVIQKKV